jgi:hypothetical protein
MKPAAQYSNKILTDDGGTVWGVLLASDATAEHECGIRQLRHLLGTATKPGLFIERVMTSEVSPTVVSGKEKRAVEGHDKAQTLTLAVGAGDNGLGWLESSLTRWGDIPLTGAFDESGFVIRGFGPDGIQVIKDIKEAFSDKDIAVWMGHELVGGLVIAIASRVPAALRESIDEADANRRRIAEAADATGIVDRLSEAGKVYFALRPEWITAQTQCQSSHPVMFWLNPMEQHANNYGWYTVEELDQWIAGEGPIPKKKATA